MTRKVGHISLREIAYKAFLKMNELRLQEGLEFLTMPNLQSRFE
jgi:hypothetical protein